MYMWWYVAIFVSTRVCMYLFMCQYVLHDRVNTTEKHRQQVEHMQQQRSTKPVCKRSNKESQQHIRNDCL